ncbi:hypothetical protein E2C01_000351 [Portunus trituberculatus]|uniref:Uncharacterized protein n=1 Tax=Portunus trituberculatus TaxID=210409 RepID=A0A5B7CGD7_PORTR|nr:hypothetical protein [Portunus trituberculatus]
MLRKTRYFLPRYSFPLPRCSCPNFRSYTLKTERQKALGVLDKTERLSSRQISTIPAPTVASCPARPGILHDARRRKRTFREDRSFANRGPRDSLADQPLIFTR